MRIEYPYPIKRIGNEINPKIIILLENPNSFPECIKRNPEYAMEKDKVYMDVGMRISVVKEYDSWWCELSKIWCDKYHDDDILALEYYPYATLKETKYSEISHMRKDKNMENYAKKALEENINILKMFMDQKLQFLT